VEDNRILVNVIDTTWRSDLAYALGLIAADGCLSSNSTTISFVSKDLELINNYQRCLGLNKKYYRSGRGGETAKNYYTLQFRSRQFYDYLNSVGITSNKSKTIKGVSVPDDYFADFFRGLFDGDGTFWTEWDTRWPNSFVFHLEIASASHKFLEWLLNGLNRLYGVKGFIKRGDGVYIIRYAKGDTRKLFDQMYLQDNLLYLTRKYEKIKNALDFEKSVDWLRKKGLSSAAKKGSRITSEGLIGVQVAEDKAVILEINSETDFVAKSEEFCVFTKDIAIIKWSKGSLCSLFDEQIETLRSRDCPQSILNMLQSKREEVISKAEEIIFSSRDIPFLPVIPQTFININELMKMVHCGKKEGRNFIRNLNDLSCVVKTPKKPYYMFDINTGKDLLGVSPERAEAAIKRRYQECLTAEEGIALCVHTNTLLQHNVNCAGSRFNLSIEGVPNIYLLDNTTPGFGYMATVEVNDKWGTPSCRSRA